MQHFRRMKIACLSRAHRPTCRSCLAGQPKSSTCKVSAAPVEILQDLQFEHHKERYSQLRSGSDPTKWLCTLACKQQALNEMKICSIRIGYSMRLHLYKRGIEGFNWSMVRRVSEQGRHEPSEPHMVIYPLD